MFSKDTIRRFVRNVCGFDIVRYASASHPLARRATLINNYSIDLVVDVGANAGSFGRQLRSIGYSGRILSFEPLSSAYIQLLNEISNDKCWTACNFALGNKPEISTINIARNS